MKIGVRSWRRQDKKFLIPAAVLVLVLAIFSIVGLSGRIWASGTEMTQLQFSNALFCQRVSQAINDSLGDGVADGSDCANFNLYVSTAEIGNIQTLDIVPPEGGFGNIDLESQPISIGGTWTTEFNNLTSLSITNMYVQNISPLRNLTGNLTYLNLSNNRISDISPLAALKNRLVYLDLSSNPIGEGLGELSKFTHLTTLKLMNTGLGSFDELFRPADPEYDEYGQLLSEPETSSDLAKVLQAFYISNNENMSSDREEDSGACDTNLMSFETYADDLAMTELYASNDHLNSDDLICISNLKNLNKLDVSNNHIGNFEPIKSKTYSNLKADSQIFIRAIASLDYSPLPAIFTQASEANYFSGMSNATNVAVPRNQLQLNNAQFNGDKVRFVNAAIASEANEDPQPATVTVPSGTGVFENSKLQVYFAGQVVTFNDTNLCNEVYAQGASGIAFYDVDGNSYWSGDPVVLTNACDAPKKQIAMVSNGSSQFMRLTLNSINDGAVVDLTGMEEFNNLQILSLRNNGLTDLEKISNDYQLQQLRLDDNDLGSEDWDIITNYFWGLRFLSLNNNHMNVISSMLANLSNLGNLYLVNNGISDVSPLAQASSLTVLDLSENDLITDFSGMVQNDSACNPSILKLENAGVTSIPDADIIETGFSNLTSLNLNGNQITDETIANLATAPRLDELYLNENRISTMSGFGEITTLKKLFLDKNQIVDVSGLSALTQLAELHLSDNQIDDVDGLDALPALATLDLKNQTLTGTIEDAEEAYELPAVFLQATTLEFPNVSGFQSAGEYTVSNGTIDYDELTATMTDTSEVMTVTIPDGGLAGTKVTVTYTGEEEDDDEEFDGTLTDRTDGGATIAPTSANSFTVTSDLACMALWTQDNGTTWNRLLSSPVIGNTQMRKFDMSQIPNWTEVLVAYAGDVDNNNSVNVRDARKIVKAIIGNASMSNLEEKLADIDNNSSINVRDVRKIINSIMGTAEIDW